MPRCFDVINDSNKGTNGVETLTFYMFDDVRISRAGISIRQNALIATWYKGTLIVLCKRVLVASFLILLTQSLVKLQCSVNIDGLSGIRGRTSRVRVRVDPCRRRAGMSTVFNECGQYWTYRSSPRTSDICCDDSNADIVSATGYGRLRVPRAK